MQDVRLVELLDPLRVETGFDRHAADPSAGLDLKRGPGTRRITQ
jgi:hypothetical protein